MTADREMGVFTASYLMFQNMVKAAIEFVAASRTAKKNRRRY